MSAKSAAKPRRKVNGYKKPEPIPSGHIITDNSRKKSWQIGKSIGIGGFGEIYSANEVSAGGSVKNTSYPYVVKIEPHENGPLFVEMHFYMKNARPEDIEKWMKMKKLKSFGMPCYLGSGSFEYNNEKYRFLVMDRYANDLWSLFLSNNKKFTLEFSLKLALQIIGVLEYIHSRGYAHCDVKGSNLLFGLKKGTENQIYLVDFGLASRFNTNSVYKPDPKKAHNGTIEYTSQDAHKGVITRRGDMEILGFNLLHWVTSTLPWENNISDPKAVEAKKNDLMSSVPSYFKNKKINVPTVIIKYLEQISKLKHDEAPNYDEYSKMFLNELKSLGSSDTSLNLTPGGKKNKKLTNENEVVSPKKRMTKKKIPESALNSCHMSDEDEQQEPVSSSVTNDVPKKTHKSKKESSGISWKDCPTAKASNINRPGEYKRKSPRAVTTSISDDSGRAGQYKGKIGKSPTRSPSVKKRKAGIDKVK